MRRLHLFELGDQPWLPRALRDDLTALLAHQLGDVYRPLVPRLAWWLGRCGCTRVVDLASGAGGPWPVLQAALAAEGRGVDVLLTDLHLPRDVPTGGALRYHPEGVDARAVPDEPGGCRTLFTGLHHLRPEEARTFLQRAADARVPLAVAEFTERRWGNALGMLLSPLLVWRDVSALRPRRWGRWVRTYLVPVLPAVYAWDGAVSHLRTYTVDELRGMTAAAEAPGYRWDVGQVPGQGYTLTYVFGYPG